MDTQELQKIKNQFDIIGNDAALNRALEMAVAIAPTDLTVLVTGENGVGKESIPNIIHRYSTRRNAKYFALNCGAIPEGTVDAELFGHEKGSFTGAIEARKGYFEEYDGGTLFLDEIGELPLASQAKLLRVLQSGEFIKVGSSKVQKTDVRVIAATNVNLLHAVSKGKFREDLYYRLNAVQISVPSLRERKEDIYLLFRKFSSDFSESNKRVKISLTNEAIDLLIGYRWPGNIRQLKNIAEAITAIESRPITPQCERVELDAATLLGYIPSEKDSLLPAVSAGSAEGGKGSFSDSDKQMIIKALLDLKGEVDRLRSIVEGRGGEFTAADGTPRRLVGTDSSIPEPEEQACEPEREALRVDDQTQGGDILPMRKANDEMIMHCLAKHGGKVKPAAAELGISERTIYRKLAEKKNR